MDLANLSNQVKKPTKAQAQNLVKRLYADMEQELTAQGKENMAQLYALFMPPKAKIAKTGFDWVAKAMAGKKDPRYYMRYVHVSEDGEWIEATDGHRVHRIRNKGNMAPGYYLPNGDPVSVDGRYPEVKRVIPDLGPYFRHVVPLDKLEVIENKEVISYVMPNGQHIQKKYLDDVFNGQSVVVVHTRGDLHSQSSVYIENDHGFAVIMPVRQ
jgi:hypothetical protein